MLPKRLGLRPWRMSRNRETKMILRWTKREEGTVVVMSSQRVVVVQGKYQRERREELVGAVRGRRQEAAVKVGRQQSAGRDAVSREDAKRMAIVLRKTGSLFRMKTALLKD